MIEKNQHLEDLKEIRSLMERSSRFISLSGLSGIFAGIFALAGAAAAYWYLNQFTFSERAYLIPIDPYSVKFYLREPQFFLFMDAGIVFLLALSAGIFFTTRQAKKKGQTVWDKTSKRLIINVAIPIIAGAFFVLALIKNYEFSLIAPATLIFYGLALLNGSKFTLDDIRYLAFSQIVLGIIASFFPGHGIFFLATGFGILHIVYGTVMYLKYEK